VLLDIVKNANVYTYEKISGECYHLASYMHGNRLNSLHVLEWCKEFEKETRGQFKPQEWMEWFEKYGLFQFENPKLYKEPKVLDPQTVLQPERMESQLAVRNSSAIENIERGLDKSESVVEKSAEDDLPNMTNDILKSLALSHLSVYIWASSNTGKSTFMRALARAIFEFYPKVQYMFIDLQANRWLGLEVDPSITIMAVLGDDGDMLKVCEAVGKVYEEFQKRTREKQRAVRAGKEPTLYHPIKLFFNEWNRFYSWATTYKGSKLKEYINFLELKGKKDSLKPLEVVDRMNAIFGTGRDCQMCAVVCGQEITQTQTGFSPGSIGNVNIVALGRVDDTTGDGGYGAVSSLVTDSNRITNKLIRDYLNNQLTLYMKAGLPVIITSQGNSAIGPLPDYREAIDGPSASIVREYARNYPVIAEVENNLETIINFKSR
jgi:hypothetical protein